MNCACTELTCTIVSIVNVISCVTGRCVSPCVFNGSARAPARRWYTNSLLRTSTPVVVIACVVFTFVEFGLDLISNIDLP